MSILPLLFLFCSTHGDVLPFRYFDVCELNHKYESRDESSTDGRITFDQLIVYNWDYKTSRFIAQGFAVLQHRKPLTAQQMLEAKNKFAQENPGKPIPEFNGPFKNKTIPVKKGDFYELIFSPIHSDNLIHIRFRSYFESHTAFDPEIVHAREILPKDKRVSWPTKVIKMPTNPAPFFDHNPTIMLKGM